MHNSISVGSNYLASCNPALLLFHLARKCAMRQGLSASDADDCAIAFVEKMYREQSTALKSWPRNARMTRRINVCLRNHIRDFCRHQTYIRRWEMPWTEQDEDVAVFVNPGTALPMPCPHALRKELRHCIQNAAKELAPDAFRLLLRHSLGQETFAELAAQTGATPDAVRMVVLRARRHLRTALERQGITAEDAAEYLAELSRGGGGSVAKNVEISAKCAKSPVRFCGWESLLSM